jgi:hypothetical protein
MAKMTIAIFFLVGIVIFLFLRYALIGLRAAYKHVENSTNPLMLTSGNDHQIEDAIQSLSANLRIQINGATSKYTDDYKFQNKLRDEFSLGYVFGFLRATTHIARINDEIAFFIAVETFKRVYGQSEGLNLFKAAEGFLDKKNSLFERGRADGIEDAINVSSGKFAQPRWLAYLDDTPPTT